MKNLVTTMKKDVESMKEQIKEMEKIALAMEQEMEAKFTKFDFENVHGLDLTPKETFLNLTYTEKDIVRLCNQYIEQTVGIRIPIIVLRSFDNTTFSVVPAYKYMPEADIALLNKAELLENRFLERVLKKIFNTSNIYIGAHIVDENNLIFKIGLPLNV